MSVQPQQTTAGQSTAGSNASTVGARAPAVKTPTPIPITVTSDAVTHGNPALPEVALVFNVGAGYTPATEILNILQQQHVPTTFFVMGWIARKNPDLVRTIAGDGFEIGSHGDQVPDLTQVSDQEIVNDLQTADQALSSIIGHTTKPIWSPSASAEDARVRQEAAQIGYDTLMWDIDSGDWRTDASEQSILNSVLPRLKAGDIVVLHLDSPHSVDATVPALPQILATLSRDGLHPVAISTLLRHLADDGAQP